MAIQQIGGRNVYVITGSASTGGRTSTGQSWADLVTQQRYTLYDAAYKQALREYESGKLSNEQLRKKQEELKNKLITEREERQDSIRTLNIKNIESKARAESQNVKAENIAAQKKAQAGTKGTLRSAKPIPTKEEYIEKLMDESREFTSSISDLRRQAMEAADARVKEKFLSETEMYSFLKNKDAETISGSAEYKSLIKAIKRDIKRKEAREKDIEFLETQTGSFNFEEWFNKENSRSGSVASQYVAPKVKEVKPTSFDDLIEKDRQRIREIDLEIEALDFKDLDNINVLERAGELTREMESRPIRQPREPRERGRFRRAEMEALGESPEPDVPLQLSGAEPTGMTDTAVTESPTITEPVQATYGSLENKEIPIQDPGEPLAFRDIDPPRFVGEELEDFYRTDPMAFPARGEMPRVQRISAIPLSDETEQVEVAEGPQSSRRAIRKNIQNQFKQVRNLDDQEKTTVAIQLLEEYKDQFGVSSKEYNKYKKLILDELEKSQNPEEAKAHRAAEQYIKKDPTAAANLLVPNKLSTSFVVANSTQKLVQGVFGGHIQKFANEELDLAELDKLRTNAIEQVNKTAMAQGKKDALELIDIMYWTVIEQSR
tara:strand:- start:15334 stop:17148 length:1815 start_codon:yes stop_codon:yes gene_type:complete